MRERGSQLLREVVLDLVALGRQDVSDVVDHDHLAGAFAEVD